MSKRKQLICHYCKELFDRETLIQVTKTKRACSKCNDTIVREKNEYKELIDYLCKGLNIKAPSGFMLKSIEKVKALGYSYKDIQWTVYYMACIRKMFLKDGCVNLVPSFYQEMCEYRRIYINAMNNKVEECKETIVVKHTETRAPKIENTRLINIEEII